VQSLRSTDKQAQIVISYSTPAGETRDYVNVLSVFVGLPLTVNVQDFFRAKR
jgi:hypothetical protein